MTEEQVKFFVLSLEAELKQVQTRKKTELEKHYTEYDSIYCAMMDSHIIGLESALTLLEFCIEEK